MNIISNIELANANIHGDDIAFFLISSPEWSILSGKKLVVKR